jgi:hypothetical protein
MTLNFAVVYEAASDFQLATELADREICDAISWLEHDQIIHLRTWLCETTNATPLTWKQIKAMALKSGITVNGHFSGEPALPDARAGRRAILFLLNEFPGLDGVVLIRDRDNEPDRLGGLEQARQDKHQGIPIVIGFANIERESWVISGFDPQNQDEQTRLEDERQNLGFDPRTNSHDLTAGKNDQALRSPKRVLRVLTTGDHERESMCWRDTPLVVLRDRGSANGLRSYLDEVRTRLAVLIGHTTRPEQR